MLAYTGNSSCEGCDAYDDIHMDCEDYCTRHHILQLCNKIPAGDESVLTKTNGILIDIKYHNDNPKLELTDKGDWVDLYTAEDVTIDQFEYKLLSLGVSMELPGGYEALVVPRSSTFKHWGLIQTNSVGVIDNSYSHSNDVWHFPCYKLTKGSITIPKGTRLCQFRIIKNQDILFEEKEELSSSQRGGFGTSGK